ncbi:MAG: M48 family metallopeptidase [Chloroflexi bacterium]|nr:M48 family metallopeptidase [Chloroflexota bacterium]
MPVPEVEVRRSPRRRRTVSAYRDGGRIVVLIPARFSRREEACWVQQMVERVVAKETRAASRGDAALVPRCEALSRQYLGGKARPASVKWVEEMRTRWASCTPVDGTIRVSFRLAAMPVWVLDYVLMHELVHLLIADHNAEFWHLVSRYPKAERARGYLDGVSAAASLAIRDDLLDDLGDADASVSAASLVDVPLMD